MSESAKQSSASTILTVLSAIMLALALFFGFQGMDKKGRYYLNEHDSSRNINAYVGGDAYNYIINGTYFSGYCALCGGLLAGSAATFSAGMVIKAIEASSKREAVPDASAVQDELPSI